MAGMDFIKQVVAKKNERLVALKAAISEDELKARIKDAGPLRSFKHASSRAKTGSVIAEFKNASPSAGVIRDPFNIQEIAQAYTQAQVQAVSVLTEEDFFMGDIQHLNQVRGFMNVPILRKDFIIDPYQVYESRVCGADAILLIAAILTKENLRTV